MILPLIILRKWFPLDSPDKAVVSTDTVCARNVSFTPGFSLVRSDPQGIYRFNGFSWVSRTGNH